jgi:hypothetical protein
MGRMRSAAIVVAAGLALAGCGGGGSSHKTANADTSKSNNTPAANSSGNGDSTKQLDDLTAAAEAASKATFKAVYNSNESSGSSSTVTIEQKPPKSVFISGDSSVINDGSTTYFCSKSGDQTSCVTQSGSVNPMASVVALFSPQAAITALKAAHTALVSKIAGYDVSYKNETIGGESSDCVVIKAAGQDAKYCVTKAGILAYSGNASSNFQLSSYSSSVSDSDFALPSGATTVSVPSSNG